MARNKSVVGISNPLAFFLIITFGFSYLVGLPFSLWLNQAEFDLPFILSVYLPRLLIVLGPAVGAITTCYYFGERKQLIELLQKLRPHKQQLLWYIILPAACLGITAASYLFAGLPLSRLIEIVTSAWPLLLMHWIVQCLVIGIGEELGWRMWLLPQLNAKYNFLKSILLTLLIWGLWHFPILFYGFDIVMPWLLILIGSTITLAWLWLKSRVSVLHLAIAHGSINTFQFFLENHLGEVEAQLMLEGWKISGYFYFGLGSLLLIPLKGVLLKKNVLKRAS